MGELFAWVNFIYYQSFFNCWPPLPRGAHVSPLTKELKMDPDEEVRIIDMVKRNTMWQRRKSFHSCWQKNHSGRHQVSTLRVNISRFKFRCLVNKLLLCQKKNLWQKYWFWGFWETPLAAIGPVGSTKSLKNIELIEQLPENFEIRSKILFTSPLSLRFLQVFCLM